MGIHLFAFTLENIQQNVKKNKDCHINDLEINLKKTLCVSSLRMKQEIIAEEYFKNTDSQKLNQAQR